MSEPDRIVSQSTYWINAHVSPPDNGKKVRVLNRGGCDAGQATWNEDSILYFDGWLEIAKVPDDIKQIQLDRMM